MSPSRRVSLSAYLVCIAALAVSTLPAPAVAQRLLDGVRQELDLLPDATERSPRLFGMGRLALVVPDVNNQFTLWDFGGLAAGALEGDSVSNFELRPVAFAASNRRFVNASGATLRRQTLAARDGRVAFEGYRRSPQETTFGMTGEFGILRTDVPVDDDREVRHTFNRPSVRPLINGRMPLIFQDRMRYGLHGVYSFETIDAEYRRIVSNGLGQWLDLDGQLLPSPDLFTPLKTEVSTTGGGASLRYDFGPWLVAGAGVDVLSSEIDSENIGLRHGSFVEEERPYTIGQAMLRGAIGPNVEWIADGRGWRSSSEAAWRFTISAGQGVVPLTGRGKLLEREEEGSSLRTRARMTMGSLELGAGFQTGYRRVGILPPDPADRTSFNYFRNTTFLRANSDSIFLPDSVSRDTSWRRSWGVSGGLAWRAPWRDVLIGVEYHYGRDRTDQLSSGQGPWRDVWDVRFGAEVPLNGVATVRGGYIYRDDDRDELTLGNEFLSSALTLGLGLTPRGSAWGIEAGYMFEWGQADFGDPAEPNGSRNQFAMQVRWTL